MEAFLWIIFSVLAWPVSSMAFDYLLANYIQGDIHVALQALLASAVLFAAYLLYKIFSRLQLGFYTFLFIYLANFVLLLFMHPLHKQTTYKFFDELWEEEEKTKLDYLKRRVEPGQ